MVARLPKGWTGEEPVRPQDSPGRIGREACPLIRGPGPPVTQRLALLFPPLRPDFYGGKSCFNSGKGETMISSMWKGGLSGKLRLSRERATLYTGTPAFVRPCGYP